MKKMLTENIWLKLISVILAAVLWVLILYTYDPAATADFTLNVNIINGETITSLGKVYEVLEGNTVTIRVKANSSLVKTLRTNDFEATADVSKLSPTSHANIDVICKRANNIDIRLIGNVKFLEVKLEDLVTKQFPVIVDKRGEAEEGFFVGNAIPKPNFITVSGGKSSINKIKSVRVRVDAENSVQSFTTVAVPKAYDIDGYEITTGSLKYSVNPITVALNIFKTKEVPVAIKTTGEPYTGYALESINYEPKKVLIAGSDENLEKISKITLPIEVDGEITNVESSLRIMDFIQEGLYLTDPDTVVNVNAKIVRLGTKEILLPLTQVALENQKEEFLYEPILESDTIRLALKGLQHDLEKVDTESLKASIDFGEVTEAGEVRLKLSIEPIRGITLPEGVQIDFLVREKEEETSEEPSGEPEDNKPQNEQGKPTENNESTGGDEGEEKS